MKKSSIIHVTTLFLSLFSTVALADSYSLYGQWPSNNNGSSNLNVGADNILNVKNVSKILPIWTTIHNGDHVAVQSTPTIADGNVYFADSGGVLYSYTEDGKLNWAVQLKDDQKNPEFFDGSPVLTQGKVFIAGRQMHAVDRKTGKSLWATVWDPHFASVIPTGDLLPSNVMVAGNLVIYGVTFADEDSGNVALFPYDHGEIIAFNQDSGATAWRLDLTKVKGVQYGGGVGTFGNGSVDEQRHLFFIGTSNENVPPVSPLSDSLLAIDYTTGKIAWSYQYVANDAWNGNEYASLNGTSDLDVGGHPQIFSIQLIPGLALSSIDLVGAHGKDGTYRIFTRDQLNPSNVRPIAQIQVDPASALMPIGVTPAIANGTLYIQSAGWIQDPTQPTVHTTLDTYGFEPPYSDLVTTLRAIDLRKLVLYGTEQLNQGNTQPVCLGTFIPSRCTGTLPSNIINWQASYSAVGPYSSSGMLYDNGVIMFGDGTYGNVLLINATNGKLISEIPVPTAVSSSGMYGGVSVDNGKLFIPYGEDYDGYAYSSGGITAFALPVLKH